MPAYADIRRMSGTYGYACAAAGVHVPTPGTFAILELPSREFTVRYAFDGEPVEGRCPRVVV